MQQLSTALTQLTALVATAPLTPVPSLPRYAPEPCVGTPIYYAGDPENCVLFLTNFSLLFHLQPHTFTLEDAMVVLNINHLTGRARLWETAEWKRQTPVFASFQTFTQELCKVLRLGDSWSETAQVWLSLCQGDQSLADFSIDFCTKARWSDWNSPTLCNTFLQSLEDYIKYELVSHDIPPMLDKLIRLRIGLDLGFQACHTSLTLQVREHHRQTNLCMYCSQGGNFVSHCLVKAILQHSPLQTTSWTWNLPYNWGWVRCLFPVRLQSVPWMAIFWGPSLIRLLQSTCSCPAIINCGVDVGERVTVTVIETAIEIASFESWEICDI